MHQIKSNRTSATTVLDFEHYERRERLVHDLVMKEREYVLAIESFLDAVAKPLKKNFRHCGIDGKEVEKVFHNLEHICSFHEMFLQVLQSGQGIVGSYANYGYFVEMYKEYIRTYLYNVRTVGQWRSIKFREFLQIRMSRHRIHAQADNRVDSRHQSFARYLHLPLEHIQEYHKIFHELKSDDLTPPGHAERTAVYRFYDFVDEAFKMFKKKKKDARNMTKCLEVQLQIHGDFEPFVATHREFINSRDVQMKQGQLFSKMKQIKLFLFSDMIIWASARGRFKGMYEFAKERIECSKSGRKDAEFWFGNVPKKQIHTVVVVNEKQRDDWVKDIQECIMSCSADAMIKNSTSPRVRFADEEGTHSRDSSYSSGQGDPTPIGGFTPQLAGISEHPEIGDTKEREEDSMSQGTTSSSTRQGDDEEKEVLKGMSPRVEGDAVFGVSIPEHEEVSPHASPRPMKIHISTVSLEANSLDEQYVE